MCMYTQGGGALKQEIFNGPCTGLPAFTQPQPLSLFFSIKGCRTSDRAVLLRPYTRTEATQMFLCFPSHFFEKMFEKSTFPGMQRRKVGSRYIGGKVRRIYIKTLMTMSNTRLQPAFPCGLRYSHIRYHPMYCHPNGQATSPDNPILNSTCTTPSTTAATG